MDSQATHPSPSNPNRIKPNISKKASEIFERLLFKLAETQRNAPLTPAAKTHVQDRLNQFFSLYKTPDHPPYTAMIERAIRELNEKGGSSEDSISKFLQKEFNGCLPLAHPLLLKHHLRKLCESSYIVARLGKRYMLVGGKSLSEFKIKK